MAVIQAQSSGGGLGGILGGLATLGGALTGQPWLSALGTGIGMMTGNNAGGGGVQGALGGLLQGQTLKDILDTLSGTLKNPASGSIATGSKLTNAEINDNWQKAQILQNQSPYLRGVNAWGLY